MVNNSQAGEEQANAADQAIGEHLVGQTPILDAGDAAETAAKADEAVLDDLEQLRKQAAERDEFLNLLQHLRADYANYQKRVQKEVDTVRRFASQPLILDLLAGLDNLERAMQTADTAGNSTGLLQGIRLVHQQLLAALARHGVRPIAAQGKTFDPEFHEALLEQPAPDRPDRAVLQELQKGYLLHDRVIRPAKVVVSKAAAVAEPLAASPATQSK